MASLSAKSPSAPSEAPNTPANSATHSQALLGSLSSYISTTSILLTLLSFLFTASLFIPAQRSRAILAWLDRKRYQYELTSSLYMLTSTEKFIFNSLLFLLLAITVIAGSLYLPDHVATIASRVYYYVNGGNAPPKLYT